MAIAESKIVESVGNTLGASRVLLVRRYDFWEVWWHDSTTFLHEKFFGYDEQRAREYYEDRVRQWATEQARKALGVEQ